MTNTPAYTEWRTRIEDRFSSMTPVPGSLMRHLSPSGSYELEVCQCSAGEGTWNYSRGQGRVSSVSFGRELSPVLYIELPHWTDQRELSPPSAERRRISDEENEQLVGELKAKFVGDLGATSFGFDRRSSRQVRVGWH